MSETELGVDLVAARKAIEDLLSEPLLSRVGTAKPRSGIVPPNCKVKAVDVKEDAETFTRREDNWLWVGTRLLNAQTQCVLKSFGYDWVQQNANKVTALVSANIPADLSPHLAPTVSERIEGFEQAVMEKLRYDLRKIGLSHVYASIMPIAYYRDYIEPWYRAGYFPCNWASVPRSSEELADLVRLAKILVY